MQSIHFGQFTLRQRIIICWQILFGGEVAFLPYKGTPKVGRHLELELDMIGASEPKERGR